MKYIKYIFILLTISSISCTHNYVKPGVSYEAQSNDLNYCDSYSSLMATRYTMSHEYGYEYSRNLDIYKGECLESRGYIAK